MTRSVVLPVAALPNLGNCVHGWTTSPGCGSLAAVAGLRGDCYLCGAVIERDQATVLLPRLALRLHLYCYERDLGLRRALWRSEGSSTTEAPLISALRRRRAG